MDPQIIEKISRQVIQKFPAMRGSSPKVQDYGEGQFLLIFSGSGAAPDGRTIRQTVRVVAGADGKVIKMTSAR